MQFPFLQRFALAAVLIGTAAIAIPAADGASSTPKIEAFETVMTWEEDIQRLAVNFFIYLNDFDLNADKVEKIRVNSLSGSGWTIDPVKYRSNPGRYFGGWGYWTDTMAGGKPPAMANLDYQVVLTLKGGARLERSFRIPLPERPANLPGARFVYAPHFKGLVTHLHVPAMKAARVLAAWQDAAGIHIRFAADDPAAVNGHVAVRDAADKRLSVEFKNSDGSWFAGLNGGAGLAAAGAVNHIDLAPGLFTADPAVPFGTARTIQVVLVDRAAETGRRSSTSTARSFGRQWLLGNQAGAPLQPALAAVPTAPDASPVPIPAIGAIPWTESDRDRWEDNLPCVLLAMNDENFSELPLGPDTSAKRKSLADGLVSDWDISDRRGVVELAESFLAGTGHTARYERWLALAAAEPDASPENLAAQHADQGLTAFGVRFVRFYGPLTGTRGLKGWDLARLARVVRAACQVGYIGEDECRVWLDRIGVQARSLFASWEDWQRNYQIGRMFWGGDDQAAKLYLQSQEAVTELTASDSPLTDTPWPPAALAVPSAHR